jgi:prefoldin subunit 5
MAKPLDPQVIIPYSQLVELLKASQRIKEYESEVKRLNDQVLALRIMQSECMEQIRELKKLV